MIQSQLKEALECQEKHKQFSRELDSVIESTMSENTANVKELQKQAELEQQKGKNY